MAFFGEAIGFGQGHVVEGRCRKETHNGPGFVFGGAFPATTVCHRKKVGSTDQIAERLSYGATVSGDLRGELSLGGGTAGRGGKRV